MSTNYSQIEQTMEILVADDDISSRRLLIEILSKTGYRVRPADSPQVALESVRALPPSLILLDVRMPGMSGFEVCRRLKQDEHTRDIPIIFVSALQDVEDRVQGFNAGGIDFISKPIEELEVLARVKTHLELRKMQLNLEQLVSERTAALIATNQALEEEIQERELIKEERDRILNLSQDLICVAGMDGYFKYLNPAWERTLGYSQEELLAKPFLDFIHPDDHLRNEDEVEKLSSGEPTFNFENRYIHKNGSIRVISWTATPLLEVQMMYWIGRDITERDQAERKLQESEENFRSTFNQAAVGIAHVSPEGRFLRINRRFCEIVGYSQEEMLKRTFQEITHPDDLESDLEATRQVLAGESDTYAIEKRYLHKNGKVVWVNLTVSLLRDASGKPRWFVSVVEDITPRKNIEHALSESERNYRTLAEQAHYGIAVIQDGRIKFANQKLAELSGQIIKELINTPFSQYIPTEDQDKIVEMYRQRMMGETVPAIYDAIIQHQDGSRVDVEFNAGLIDYKGKPADLVIVRDIRERKQREREIQSYQQRLKALALQLTLAEEQERRRIAAELHDHIGQLLTFAGMQVAAVRNEAQSEKRNRILDELANTIQKSIRDTRSLVYELSSPLLNEIGLEAAIDEWLNTQVQKSTDITTELIVPDQKLVLTEDIRAILFRNTRELVTNVIRHAQASQVRVILKQDQQGAKVIIQDDGIGFDPDSLAPMITRSGRFGLFSVQERMQNLGGSIEIESAPGKGSKITLVVPI